jgi:ribosomal protein S18 acetylase RimI-like enzyme
VTGLRLRGDDCTVRAASIDDADALALVGAATFLETFAGILDGGAIVAHCMREHSGAAYRRYLEGGAEAWLAEAGSGRAPVGYALLGACALPGTAGGDLELKRIYVLPRFHGAGVGAALMRRAVARATQRGARRLLLGVYADNERALSFYARSGFDHVADRLFRVGDRDYADKVLARALD